MPSFDQVLAIETSCDDTSVAIVNKEGEVKSICSVNQDLAHKPFGGIVPEVAGRNHVTHLMPLVELCFKKGEMKWSDIQGITVTSRPGLIGSLIVGLVTAKTLSFAHGIPFIGVNHLEGHLLAPFLKDKTYRPPENFCYPYIALTVSGGHSHLCYVKSLGEYHILGQTIDDAAGEAFDKFAKVLGLGFPGGVQVDKFSKQGSKESFIFPRPLIKEDNYNFSFSGLKTAGLRAFKKLTLEEQKKQIPNLCASYQEAIVDCLMQKAQRAIDKTGIQKIIFTGGVSANSRLRERALEWSKKNHIEMVIPPLRYCTDNAAMIGYAGIQRLNRGEFSLQSLEASPSIDENDFIMSV